MSGSQLLWSHGPCRGVDAATWWANKAADWPTRDDDGRPVVLTLLNCPVCKSTVATASLRPVWRGDATTERKDGAR